MKKLILLGLCMVFLLGVVSAFYEGQELTQQQIDNFNISVIDWQFLECTKDGHHIENWQIYIDYSCWYLEKVEESYVVWRGDYSIGVKIKTILQCISEYGVSDCRDGYREYVRTQALRTVDIIKKQIADYQTSDDEGIAGWFDDWELFT